MWMQKPNYDKIFMQTVCKLLITLTLFFSFVLPIQANDDKFLIIHLDAVSSVDFFHQLELGSFPNMEAIFESGQRVKYGVSLYPGGTEIVMPRLKQGLDNSQHRSVSWGYYDRETGKKYGGVSIFFDMFGGFARHNRHQFVLGFPGLHHLAGLSLLNIEYLWENHNVVEFFWFHTDAVGHFFGRKSHLNSVKALDYYLGVAEKAGKLQEINIVIYVDHGMSMDGVKVVRPVPQVSKIIGDALLYFVYPNIYLENPELKADLAEELIDKGSFDLALLNLDSETMGGYHADGYFKITKQGSKYAYEWWGRDYFSYDSLGYAGAYLSKEEWLSVTRDHLYPAVPPNIFNYLSNPYVGDIVAILDRPHIPYSIHTSRGNHNSLTNTDLLVPLLYTGPAFAEVEPFEEFWLHELYTEKLPMIDFTQKPRRENHFLFLAYPLQAQVSLSPSYRHRLGVDISPFGIEPWVQYDVYRSFLSRVWVGAGWRGKFQPHVEIEGFLGDFSLVWNKRYGETSETKVRWRLSEQVNLKISKNSLGVEVAF